MRDRIEKFIQPDSDIAENKMFALYLDYFAIPYDSEKSLTRISTIHKIINSDHQYGKVLEKCIEFNPNLHEFMYIISGDSTRNELPRRLMLYLLREWMLNSGHSSQDFLDMKRLSQNNISHLFRLVYSSSDLEKLKGILLNLDPDVQFPGSVEETEEMVQNVLRDYIYS